MVVWEDNRFNLDFSGASDLLGFFEPVIFVRQLGWVELDCAA
jgi:hypothetical protein